MMMGVKHIPVITTLQSKGVVNRILTGRNGGRRYCKFLISILILIASVENCIFRYRYQSMTTNLDGSLANQKIEDLNRIQDGTAYWMRSMRGMNKIFESYHDFGSGQNNDNNNGDENLTRMLMGVDILSEGGFYVLPATWFHLIDANNYPVGSMENANTVKYVHYFRLQYIVVIVKRSDLNDIQQVFCGLYYGRIDTMGTSNKKKKKGSNGNAANLAAQRTR